MTVLEPDRRLTTRLARLGFSGAEEAARTVQRLALDDGDGGELVIDACAASADAALALNTLGRLADSCGHSADLLAALRWHTGLRERLIPVLGASAGLGDHLVRHCDDWTLLADDDVELSRPTTLGLRYTLLQAVGADRSQPLPWGTGGAIARDASDATLDALRVAYRRQLLLLAARDLTGRLEMDDVAAELADLAAAALDAGLAVAAAGLPADAVPVRLAVIGMGKCGGRELNYRSDVDIMVVAEPLAGYDEQAGLRTGTQLTTGLVRALAAMTGEGDCFPVDLALRPEGKAGPLVRTLASHMAYYRGWAHTWELQALIKARPVAGDHGLGQEFVDLVSPLVWQAAAIPDLPGEVQRMRRRVEATLPKATAAREIKLGPGGLRDVEFSVQLLQLVHGRSDPSLRSGSTLAALEALTAGGYIGRDDAEPLAAAYRFLRHVEHRLQLQRLRRTHTVPADGDPDRLWLARACGYRGDALGQFDADLRRHAAGVRRLHEKLFYRPLLGAVARLPAEDAQLRLTTEQAAERLQALGFAETRQALAHITALTSGISRRASIQRTLLPVLLLWFAEEADPDAGLLAFRRISDALGTTPWYLRSLRDEGKVAERLARLLASSRYVADLLARSPESMLLLGDDTALTPRSAETLSSELLAVARRSPGPESAVAAVRGLRRVELLRTAAADLLGLITVDEVQRALTGLATATVGAALDVAFRKVVGQRESPVRIAVVALGRLGSAELGYGSDADVVFVHEPTAGADESEAARLGRTIAEETRRLLASPAPDPPFTLDAGLRPEGRGGELTQSLAAFARYHQTRGQVWERQALLRAAPLAGDADLLARFIGQIAPLRWPAVFTPEEVAEVRRLRHRVQTERVNPGLRPGERWRDLKLGPGGLADVEWAVQLLQLRHAHEVPGLRVPGTLVALRAAVEAGLVSEADGSVLDAGFRATSRMRDATVLVTGRGTGVLPLDGRGGDGVRRVVGAEVYDCAAERAGAVRAVADAIINR